METPQAPRVGSAVVVRLGDTILLGKRNKSSAHGKWVIPGGGVRFGETAQEAGKREIKEETNLDLTILRFLEVKEIIATEANYHGVVFFHVAEPLNPEQLQPSADLSEAGFFTIGEIKTMDCVSSVQEVLKNAGLWKE